MDTSKTIARRAGFYYLDVVLFGIFGLLYMPSQIFVAGDAAATAANIASHPFMFRAGIVSQLICQVCFLFVALTLYQLLKGVNIIHARYMVVFVLASVPISMLNATNLYAMSILAEGGSSYASVFSRQQVESQILFFENLYQHGILIAEIFWGLWLIPLGYLAFKSEMFPKILGIWLILDGIGYITDFMVANFLPAYRDSISFFVVITGCGEFAFVIYLLVKGVKTKAEAFTPGLTT